MKRFSGDALALAFAVGFTIGAAIAFGAVYALFEWIGLSCS